MKYLFYDFNGTVLDDLDVSLKSINLTAKKYLSRNEITKDEYLHAFTFPIEDYYKNVGFNFDEHSYHEIGEYWFKCYRSLKDEVKLHDGIIDLLKKCHENNIKNILLSASRIDVLHAQLKELKIEEYFDEVLGIDTIYASTKLPIAQEYLKDKNPKEFFLIGDTIHDKEVAEALDIDYLLIANGHQGKDVLLKYTNKVVDSLKDFIDII